MPAEKLFQGWGARATCAFAGLFEGSGEDESLVSIQMQTQATLCAIDFVALLPKDVAAVSFMGSCVGLVQTLSVDESLEQLFIAPLVDIGSTLDTAQIACGLIKLMLLLRWYLVSLLLQKLLDDLLPGLFFGQRLMRSFWFRHLCLNAELWTFCMKVLFYGLDREGLMHSDSTGPTLVSTSVWHPPVRWCLPRVFALCNELFFVLLRALALVSVLLLVDVVIFAVEDRCQSVDCVCIDEFVALI